MMTFFQRIFSHHLKFTIQGCIDQNITISTITYVKTVDFNGISFLILFIESSEHLSFRN